MCYFMCSLFFLFCTDVTFTYFNHAVVFAAFAVLDSRD